MYERAANFEARGDQSFEDQFTLPEKQTLALPEVAALAGHRDIRMTMRYAHLAPQHLRNSIAILEARRIEQSDNALTTNV